MLLVRYSQIAPRRMGKKGGSIVQGADEGSGSAAIGNAVGSAPTDAISVDCATAGCNCPCSEDTPENSFREQNPSRSNRIRTKSASRIQRLESFFSLFISPSFGETG